jgi:hypothetical protein
MTMLIEGARQLPLRHISVRVPWNDTDWTGRICQKPSDNISCLILPRIRETRDDDQETALAGQAWADLDPSQLPPCVSERGSFMSPVPFTRKISHPYAETSEVHQHFIPTTFRYPAYSAACLPFNWMLKEFALEKVKSLELGFVHELEDEAHAAMGFDTAWVQTKQNQLVMLDTFFGAIHPKRSLCFFYAKRTPLVEDTRRVIIGAGWVTHVGQSVEYEYSEKSLHTSVIWERPVQHSIRPDFSDGFILPYHEVLQYLESHPDENPNQFVAFAPDEHFLSYSYASEHVTNDGAIASLLACAKALQNMQRVVGGRWDRVQAWIDARLNELWHMRGPYPGLGASLAAFGVLNGSLLAYEIERHLADQENVDPWPLVDNLFRHPQNHPDTFRQYIRPTLSATWKSIPDERMALLKLLSRFELTAEQATRYYVHEDKQRKRLRIEVTDEALLANPYLLYELDRTAPDPISLPVVDRGLFPDEIIRDKHPLPSPSKLDDATDERRVRAFVVRHLEQASDAGHSLQPRSRVITDIRELDVQPDCPVTGDLMTVVEGSFSPTVRLVSLANGERAYQLGHLHGIGQLINRTVSKRVSGRRHEASIPWRERLDELFGGKASPDDVEENDARAEKTAALEEMFASRISVLIGPAGTGKTTLLNVLCQEETVKQGGILALAPTGKARVRLEQQTGIVGAKTIAQFLLPLDRYEALTGTYRLSDFERNRGAKTVIIDEASMLTEAQLAAVLDALSGVQRLILVGDHRQLPPIGAGRPFLDIVSELAPANVEATFPRVAPGYTELTVRRRQTGEAREDLLLAEWFSGRPLDAGADEIWSRITENRVSNHLRFVQWETDDELRKLLLNVLVEELGLADDTDAAGFEQSIGGTLYNGRVYFNNRYGDHPGACAKVEDWQLLSPVRNAPHGVEALNRLIQATFRSDTKDFATQRWRKIPKPMGREEIIYGDKVINLKNQRRNDVWPKGDALKYVANGEIGVVVGQYKNKNARYKGLPWKLEVEFASQPGFKYGYWGKDFGEEAEPKLELAYALTIHKVQGSEFGLTFLIIPNPCRLLSRELLYTALTRQKERVIIFHQGDRHNLKQYSVDALSDAAQRLTNLFHPPNPVHLKTRSLPEGRFMEDRLIHRTRRGDSVRSKSEVIIADLLYSKGIEYEYEAPLVGTDGHIRYPDFSFEDDDLGLQIYWEHLGLMRQPAYRRRWEKKLAWYKQEGVLPHKEGGGPAGILVVTQDDEKGGIQSDEIERLLDEILF